MSKFLKYIDLLKSILRNLSLKRKKLILIQLFILSISAILEMGLVAATPFFLKKLPNLNNNNDFLFISICYSTLILISCFARVYNLWKLNKTSAILGTDLSLKAYETMLYQSYEQYKQDESNVVINNLVNNTAVTVRVINSYLNFISASLTLILIAVLLLLKYPIITVVLLIILSTSYSLISIISKNSIKNNSKIIANDNISLLKTIQEGVGSYRDTLINRSQNNFIKDLYLIDSRLRKSISTNLFLTAYPRFINESLIILIMVALAINLFIKADGASELIFSELSIFAVAGLKLLPGIQMIYSSWALINTYFDSTTFLIKGIERERPEETYLNIRNNSFSQKNTFEIKLKNVFYRYPKKQSYALNNINLNIKQGEIIGIRGESGAGKSTLLDIMMGLLIPSKGTMLFDDINIFENRNNIIDYRNIISHVPQNPYINYGNIIENITLEKNLKKIDYKKLDLALEISSFRNILKSDLKLDSYLGERGQLLSGGQRQRLSIARAIYRLPRILFLDEFTSSLDKKIEDEILINLSSKMPRQIIIIIISHRDAPLEICNRIINIDNGKIIY